MAVTRLSDLVFGENFNTYTVERSTRRNAFVAAGVMVVDPAIAAFMTGQGFLVNMPHFKRLANDELHSQGRAAGDGALWPAARLSRLHRAVLGDKPFAFDPRSAS
jgi:hypothetical protein